MLFHYVKQHQKVIILSITKRFVSSHSTDVTSYVINKTDSTNDQTPTAIQFRKEGGGGFHNVLQEETFTLKNALSGSFISGLFL